MQITIQREVKHNTIPSDDEIRLWASAAQMGKNTKMELNFRIVSSEEIRSLNKTYRNKDSVTNILSFTSRLPDSNIELNNAGTQLLADVVICAEVVRQEAENFHKDIMHRWAHMVVHGFLHVQGYNHHEAAEREAMEELEQKILNGLGIANPYQVN